MERDLERIIELAQAWNHQWLNSAGRWEYQPQLDLSDEASWRIHALAVHHGEHLTRTIERCVEAGAQHLLDAARGAGEGAS